MERLDQFMARANRDYYAQNDPFADFTTSPEISQMFGELIGAWIAAVWHDLGAPAAFRLIEAGPGRGTLMQDAWRTLDRVAPAAASAARLHLIEFSPRLRAEQATRLPHATWHDTLAGVPSGPAILIANEFLDALPIRQFLRTGDGWSERFVENGRFITQPAEAPDRSAEPGGVVEICKAALDWCSELARRLELQGGAALVIDYGTAESGPGNSLQALRHGRAADPLAEPGRADLTAHVDFAAAAAAARAAGAAVWGPVPQGTFLDRLGLAARTARLAAANPEQAASLHRAAHRLSAPEQMGTLFKAICIAQTGAPPPPGFAE